jgi:hypothetical protein
MNIKTRHNILVITMCLVLSTFLASCGKVFGGGSGSVAGGEESKDLKPVDPMTIAFLDSQIDHLTLSDAILQWGQPTFFTQVGHNNTRTAVWHKSNAKFSYGDFLGQFDPTNTYNKVTGLFGGNNDEGWELRATFNKHDVMIDWRYKEW